MSALQLYFAFRGRMSGRAFRLVMATLIAAFVLLFLLLQSAIGPDSTLILYPPFFWALLAMSSKRLHDRGKSALWLLLLLIPVIGFVWLSLELLFFRGTPGENRYGLDPTVEKLPDYQAVTFSAGGL